MEGGDRVEREDREEFLRCVKVVRQDDIVLEEVLFIRVQVSVELDRFEVSVDVNENISAVKI